MLGVVAMGVPLVLANTDRATRAARGVRASRRRSRRAGEDRRHRQRLRRAGRGDPAARAGTRRDRAREARQAGRARVRVRAGRVHIRCRTDDHHGAVADPRAVRDRGAASGGLRHARARSTRSTTCVSGRLGVPLQRATAPRSSSRFAPSSPRDVDGYERFASVDRADLRDGDGAHRHSRFSRSATWRGSSRISSACARTARSRAFVERYIRDDRLRQVFSFHPLLDRRQSVSDARSSTRSSTRSSSGGACGSRWAAWARWSAALARVLRRAGRRLRLESEVAEIEVDDAHAARDGGAARER